MCEKSDVFNTSQPKINYVGNELKKVFLKISQNSQENTCARVFF